MIKSEQIWQDDHLMRERRRPRSLRPEEVCCFDWKRVGGEDIGDTRFGQAGPQLSIDPATQRAIIERFLVYRPSIAVEKHKHHQADRLELSLEVLLCGKTIVESTYLHLPIP